MTALGRYIMNWLRWWDQGLNVLTGGDSLETLSSRAGKAQREGKRWGCYLCRFLDLFQRNHCERSINPDDGANATLPD
ncbi:hypothetical protein GNZ10_13490 [Ralstonia sp. 3N]|uniref:hypothetical protein n=1 Tax=Ralstonia sp. 3N TaxID=2675750 RepID=UPI0015C557CE|nr:hypothetical protein [Ralstonia sp. 3N]NPT50712.1 hypothetical protein [Ralstonia sp. 3N]